MSINSLLQDSSQMSNHMAGVNNNQDTIFLIAFILIVLIVALIGIIIAFFYFLYTGKIVLGGKKTTTNKFDNQDYPEGPIKSLATQELPPVSLNPLERRIIEVVMNGHNVLQSDLPSLVNSSKSKVSEALSYLEDQKLIQRIKAGRSLSIQYIYEPTN